MITKLACGDDTVALDLRGLRVRPLAPSAPPGPRDLGGLVAAALEAPLDQAPLEELASGQTSAAVVVPDSTRRADLPDVLPLVLGRIRRGGIAPSRTTVLIACGTHPPAPEATVRRLLGLLPDGVVWLQHDCRSVDDLVAVGELVPGLPLRLHRAAVDAGLLVTVGAVRHHYFAGFGGGPKLVFPGIAGYEEIQHNHSRVLDLGGSKPRRHPCCEPGVVAGNPVAEEIARAADLHHPDLALMLVPGCDGRPAWAGAGRWRGTFDAAIQTASSWYEPTAGPFRLMVASASGRPCDGTLIQAHKALDAACRFLEPGGELLLVASLDEGPGSPEMLPFLDDPRPEAIISRLGRRWIQYGHTTLRIVDKTTRFRVHLHSRLDPDLAQRLGFLPAPHADAVIEDWRDRHPGETVGVMAGAPVFPGRGLDRGQGRRRLLHAS